jgi:hypothetical protein
MGIIIGLAVLLAYEFFGIITAVVIADETDSPNGILIPCLIMWPLMLLAVTALWIGAKLRKLIRK